MREKYLKTTNFEDRQELQVLQADVVKDARGRTHEIWGCFSLSVFSKERKAEIVFKVETLFILQ